MRITNNKCKNAMIAKTKNRILSGNVLKSGRNSICFQSFPANMGCYCKYLYLCPVYFSTIYAL